MSDSRDLWMVGDLLDAMSGSNVPNYVTTVIQEIQTWLSSVVSEEYILDSADVASGEHPLSADLDYLFSRVEWVSAYADIIPILKGAPKMEDVLVLSVGPIILDEGLRMMVDHAALFAGEVCKRVWFVSDTWVIGDVLTYVPHLRALRGRGIEIRFMLVTPWSYCEIPWNNVTGERK
ncbi:MAG: hypothetical protein LBK91_07055 [Synergistaceae bacterium]|jgi:hypothetical protein|nr:hypothetical protein [Synergistaceae bacterium]